MIRLEIYSYLLIFRKWKLSQSSDGVSSNTTSSLFTGTLWDEISWLAYTTIVVRARLSLSASRSTEAPVLHFSRPIPLVEVVGVRRSDNATAVVEPNFLRKPGIHVDVTMYFPNRLELLFRTVVAFPKASKIGFVARTSKRCQ